MTSWPHAADIKVFGHTCIPITCNAASDWPRTFFTPRVFLFSILEVQSNVITSKQQRSTGHHVYLLGLLYVYIKHTVL